MKKSVSFLLCNMKRDSREPDIHAVSEIMRSAHKGMWGEEGFQNDRGSWKMCV